MITVLGMLLVLRIHAFLSLISAALLVSLLAPGDPAEKVVRVAEAFGRTAGSIGIVIALAAIIGRCLLESGAADRIVTQLLSLLGERRAPAALALSGWVLSVPVFFDTVFYLLIPLARSLYRRTGGHYVAYALSIGVGAAATHALVPPTPGPLIMATQLGIDLGALIAVGAAVALPAAGAGLVWALLCDWHFPIPMRPIAGQSQPEPISANRMPPFLWSVLPIALPVVLITSDTVVRAFGNPSAAGLRSFTGIVGNPSFALLASAVVALGVLMRQTGRRLSELAGAIEESLASGGVIILITAAGGAFGAMLQAAGVGDALRRGGALDPGQVGLGMLLSGFGIAAVLKIAQGSSTVAMIGASSILASMGPDAGGLPFHPAYLATAIGSGSLFGIWMNDSGFWIFARMSGLTELETLRTWTPGGAVVGAAGLLVTLALASMLPLAP